LESKKTANEDRINKLLMKKDATATTLGGGQTNRTSANVEKEVAGILP